MAYSQRKGVLLYKPLKMSPRLPPQLPNRHRKPFRKPMMPQNKNGHPIIQSQAWRGRLLDHQNRNKRPRLANTALKKQDWQMSKMSDAKLMNISKGFFEKKPANRGRQLPNQVRRNMQPRQAPFRGQQRVPYNQRFSGRGGPGYQHTQQNNQRPPNNRPPLQLQSNRVPPVQQPIFQGSGPTAQPRFPNLPVPPQRGVGQPPIQSLPGVAHQRMQSAPVGFTNLRNPSQGGSGHHPISNTQPPMQQFAPSVPNPGQPMFMPGQPPPPPRPYPNPMPYTQIPTQQILAQPGGAIPPGTPYPPLASQLQPFVQALRTTAIPGGSATATVKGIGKSSSAGAVDPAQDYFNSLPKPSATPKKTRKKRKFSSEPEPI